MVFLCFFCSFSLCYWYLVVVFLNNGCSSSFAVATVVLVVQNFEL